MTSASSSEMANPRAQPIQIKDDPDPINASISNGSASPLANVKKEEADQQKLDANLPDVGQGDMFEDVDGPEIVDLTYEGIAEINGVDHFVCEDFKIPQIPEPKIVTRPLKSLFDCIDSGHIVLNPDYQREVVWDEGRASLLITSILMGYFIPPIIFNVKTRIVNRNGQKDVVYTRVCVDGKQRLTSVHKFMKGQIGFFDSNSPQKKWFFCHPVVNGRETFGNHNILPRAVKDFFMKQAFCCYEYAELSLETEETMFQLVQRGIALTPAEKMRAMSTQWATFTKQYEDDYTLIVNLSKQNRASGFRLVLTIFTMIQEVMSGRRKRSSAPTLQASPQSLLKVLDDKAPIEDGLKLKFKAIFDRYENLVKLSSTQVTATRFKINNNSVFDPAPDFLRTPGIEHVRTFSPLELIGTAILVSCHMNDRTDQELLEDVKSMRIYLRLKHKDLRVNAQCWLTVWDFVTEEMARRMKSNDSDVFDPLLPASGQSDTRAHGGAGGLTSSYAAIAPVGGLPAAGTSVPSTTPVNLVSSAASAEAMTPAPTNRQSSTKNAASKNPTLATDGSSRNQSSSFGSEVSDKEVVESTRSTPSKRSTRASTSNHSFNARKTKPSGFLSTKRANSSKTSPLPSKRLKQKA